MVYVYNFCKLGFFFKKPFYKQKMLGTLREFGTLGLHFPLQESMTFVLTWLGSDVALLQHSEAPWSSTASSLSDDSG